MNKNLIKSAAVYAGIGIFVLLGFQNCSNVTFTDANGNAQNPNNGQAGVPNDPSSPSDPANPSVVDPVSGAKITLVPDSTDVLENKNVLVTVSYENLSDIKYSCSDKLSGEIVASGMVSSSGQQIPVKITQDIHCEASGVIANNPAPLKASGDVAVNCGNRIKNSTLNRCEDFSCKSVVALDRSQLGNIPARTSEGLCYALKLFDKISNSPSTLTKEMDGEVISRTHGGSNDPSITSHPYVMGKEQSEFRLLGPRSVKLSGGLDATAKILVDNFVLVGVYPSTQDPQANLNAYYKVMGSSDSSIAANGADSHSIKFIETLIPVMAFASGGTSSLAPLDITSSVQPNIYHKLDLRALDCGGVRELSDIYLLFQ